MLIRPTVARLRDIGLSAMADALIEMANQPEAADLPHADWLGLLINREATARDDRRLSRRLQAAKLATSDWVREHQHLAITGPTGTGKSWIARALGHKACRDGFSVIYKRAPRLFADIAQARGEGRLARLMTTLDRANLLIIDDWGARAAQRRAAPRSAGDRR